MKALRIKEREEWTAPLPEHFKTHYQLGRYDEERIGQVMWKYLVRSENLKRAWMRISHHLPETLTTDEKLDIIEFSTAHGAMLEIWRDKGHNVVGTDYAWTAESDLAVHKGVQRNWHKVLLAELQASESNHKADDVILGWPYQPIIESLGLDVRLFDGGKMPYPFEDKSFDVVCCYQAIEAYATADKWLDIVREFCRMARQTVVIGFNPLPIRRADDPWEMEEARKAWLEMQQFNEMGFRTTFFEIGETRRGVHPITCKIQAC